MTTQLVIDKDPGSVATFITPFSDQGFSLVMGADTDVVINVPSDANLAVMYYDTGKDIFVRPDAVVTLPSTDSPVQTAGVLLKPSVDVRGITTLHFRSNESAFLSVEFYR